MTRNLSPETPAVRVSEEGERANALPSPSRAGRCLALSGPRRWIGDILHFARQVPTVPVQRQMNLGPLLQARAALDPRPSWVALFARAYGLVALERPVLRRAYLAFPWPHLYEHPENICSVAVERDLDGEDAVFFARLRSPEAQSVFDLDGHIRRYKQAPLRSIAAFRFVLNWARVPRPLRRLALWWGLNSNGERRARRFGTFGISVYAGLGAESLHPLSPLTTTLNYGTISPEGDVAVRLIYDHRVFDGSTAARALVRLEEVLNGPVVRELEEAPARSARICHA